MKKNMLTVMILALVTVNMVLSALVVFVVVPASSRTNKLVSQIASVIDLELQSPEEMLAEPVISMDEREEYKIDGQKTYNLQKGTDGKDHFVQLDSITLSINKKSKDYKKLKATLETNQSSITDTVSNVVSSYTSDNALTSKEEIKTKIVEQFKTIFGSEDFILDVFLDNLVIM